VGVNTGCASGYVSKVESGGYYCGSKGTQFYFTESGRCTVSGNTSPTGTLYAVGALHTSSHHTNRENQDIRVTVTGNVAGEATINLGSKGEIPLGKAQLTANQPLNLDFTISNQKYADQQKNQWKYNF
jgi:hypothetical protein